LAAGACGASAFAAGSAATGCVAPTLAAEKLMLFKCIAGLLTGEENSMLLVDDNVGVLRLM
jgi:acetylglutamate kinase